jgi:hypothetical protein
MENRDRRAGAVAIPTLSIGGRDALLVGLGAAALRRLV